jgi:DNA-binding response OmpR family regulator
MELHPTSFEDSIVVVDPDPAASALVDRLTREGHRTRLVQSGRDARELAAPPPALRPALVVLELVLPDADGIAVCAHLTTRGIPVIVRSATRRRGDPIQVLRLGAQDFVPKTVGLDELIARIERMLARTERPGQQHQQHQQHHRSQPQPVPPAVRLATPTQEALAGLSFDDLRHRITFGDRSLRLSTADYTLLGLLARRPECPVPRATIAAQLWPAANPEETDVFRLVPGCVYHLRRRLERAGLPLTVTTVRGYGYVLLRIPE